MAPVPCGWLLTNYLKSAVEVKGSIPSGVTNFKYLFVSHKTIESRRVGSPFEQTREHD